MRGLNRTVGRTFKFVKASLFQPDWRKWSPPPSVSLFVELKCAGVGKGAGQSKLPRWFLPHLDAALSTAEIETRIRSLRQWIDEYKFGQATRGERGAIPIDYRHPVQINALMAGHNGVGKSSLTCTVQRSVYGDPFAGTASVGAPGAGDHTVHVSQFLNDRPIRLLDARGWFEYSPAEQQQFLNTLNAAIVPGEVVERGGAVDVKPADPDFARHVHAVIMTFKWDDPLFAGYHHSLQRIRTHLKTGGDPRSSSFSFLHLCGVAGITPIVVITHADTFRGTAAQRAAVEATVASVTGAATDCIFWMTNYTVASNGRDPIVELQALNIMQKVILRGEQYCNRIAHIAAVAEERKEGRRRLPPPDPFAVVAAPPVADEAGPAAPPRTVSAPVARA